LSVDLLRLAQTDVVAASGIGSCDMRPGDLGGGTARSRPLDRDRTPVHPPPHCPDLGQNRADREQYAGHRNRDPADVSSEVPGHAGLDREAMRPPAEDCLRPGSWATPSSYACSHAMTLSPAANRRPQCWRQCKAVEGRRVPRHSTGMSADAPAASTVAGRRTHLDDRAGAVGRSVGAGC